MIGDDHEDSCTTQGSQASVLSQAHASGDGASFLRFEDSGV